MLHKKNDFYGNFYRLIHCKCHELHFSTISRAFLHCQAYFSGPTVGKNAGFELMKNLLLPCRSFIIFPLIIMLLFKLGYNWDFSPWSSVFHCIWSIGSYSGFVLLHFNFTKRSKNFRNYERRGKIWRWNFGNGGKKSGLINSRSCETK